MLRTFLAAVFVCAATSTPLLSQSAETVFKGRPQLQIIETAINRVLKEVTAAEADGYECVVSKIGDRYYWASRENREMVRLESGAFITFLAVDGSGYVRQINPRVKAAASLMSDTEATFDYVEHILLGLRSISYYGATRASQ